MSPLAARPGRNAARQAKRLKELRHVQSAIRWAERTRKDRKQRAEDRFERRSARLNQLKWEHDNVTLIRRKALRNAAEDWTMGPLRPNRAIGAAQQKYGALRSSHVQKSHITEDVQKWLNEQRVRRGQELEYPLIVDDKKYFHLVKGDRVAVVKGRGAGRIGVIDEIVPRVHEAVIRGINMHYFDSDVFSNKLGQKMAPMTKSEVSIPLANLRLVVPYATTTIAADGTPVTAAKDVIVDKIVMERHTTGIDPFTGTDYGTAEIPKEHQYDPRTGKPIFHRYIAGTQHRIEWPWETSQAPTNPNKPKTPRTKAKRKTWISKTLGSIRHPITTLQSWTASAPARPQAPEDPRPVLTQLEEIEANREALHRRKLRSKMPRDKEVWDGDTTRNIVEGAESMAYSLVTPPHPSTLGEELRGEVHDFNLNARKDEEDPYKPIRPKLTTPEALEAQQKAKAKREAALKMKTPMQLRWEAEAARKKATKPAVDTETLMRALGRHMMEKATPKVKASRGEVE